MANLSNLVNLDALIIRADFAVTSEEAPSYDPIKSIELKDFEKKSMLGRIIRKPDFQRETNHWSPTQVVSLLECFLSGDLIPSVILWKSPTYLFVIDGGHRLSVLKAWIEDDYGDGPISKAFFGDKIPLQQLKAAKQTRKLVNEKIGSWQHIQSDVEQTVPSQETLKRWNTITTRSLQIQWVNGDAEKAQASFFKINTQGTPLDNIEELLLKNRKKSIPIAARAIIRSGKGNKYWSAFTPENTNKIETDASTIHKLIFDPEIKSPIKTLDLPLGGSKGIRTALQVLIDLMLISTRNSLGHPKDLSEISDDLDGSETVECLRKTTKILNRITGNDKGSLGLHPAVYFYGPTGRHSGPMFMGMNELIAKHTRNNNKTFFKNFTSARGKLEKILVENKYLIATIMQKNISKNRANVYINLIEKLIESINNGERLNEAKLVKLSGLEGKIVIGKPDNDPKAFSDDTKSGAFISLALKGAAKCPICSGYLDPEKSLSYDHIKPVRDKGSSKADNLQIVHPYCNQSKG